MDGTEAQRNWGEQAARAEAAARSLTVDVAALSTEDLRKLVHELQVYQVELEMQNDELRRAQLELEASRSRYIQLYDLAPVGYVTMARNGRIIESNLTAAQMLARPQSEVLRQRMTDLVARVDQDSFNHFQRELFKTNAPQVCELTLIRGDGTSFFARLDASVTAEMPGHAPAHIIIAGISENLDVETALVERTRTPSESLADLHEILHQRMVHQGQLAAVGRLSAGIAHDFNNLLNGILGHAELLTLAPDTTPDVREKLAAIIELSERAALMVRQILDFSRRSISRPQTLDLRTFLEETIAFLRRTTPENIQITLSVTPGRYLVNADAVQLQQVMTNLVVNAGDAMPTGGRLDITLSSQLTSASGVMVGENVPPGNWHIIALRDSGTGIPAELLPTIFEPFVTSKRHHGGTGLGLSQVYGIVQQHGGYVAVESEYGFGTTFFVYLPVSSALPSSVTVRLEAKSTHSQGAGETILLVEDDDSVRQVMTAMLKHLHYQVIPAANGAEGLDAYLRYRDEISLVMTDMIMPEMDGVGLFELLRDADPQAKIVFLTGYPLDVEAAALLDKGLTAWLQKPVSIAALAEVLAEVL